MSARQNAQVEAAMFDAIGIEEVAADVDRWFQLLCMAGTWRDARPRALRWGVFHAPGRLVRTARRRIVRIVDGWPTADELLRACRRIALITRARPTARRLAPA